MGGITTQSDDLALPRDPAMRPFSRHRRGQEALGCAVSKADGEPAAALLDQILPILWKLTRG
jgi:hypothetical protein